MRRKKIISEGNTDSQWGKYFRKREAFKQGKKVIFFMKESRNQNY